MNHIFLIRTCAFGTEKQHGNMNAIWLSVRSQDALMDFAPGVYQQVLHWSLSQVYHRRKADRSLALIYPDVSELKNPRLNLPHCCDAARISRGLIGAGDPGEERGWLGRLGRCNRGHICPGRSGLRGFGAQQGSAWPQGEHQCVNSCGSARHVGYQNTVSKVVKTIVQVDQ